MRRTSAWRSDLKAVVEKEPSTERGLAVEGQTFAGQSFAVRYVNLVKLPHTVFALPFALVGLVYGSAAAPVTALDIVLVTIAFTAARFVAMGFNRIVDRHIDAENPRTRDRELPSGRLSPTQAAVAVAAAGVIFVVCAALLNPLCLRGLESLRALDDGELSGEFWPARLQRYPVQP